MTGYPLDLDVGDLVYTTGFGPQGRRGEIGIVVKFKTYEGITWVGKSGGRRSVPVILFQKCGELRVIARQGLVKMEKRNEY